MKVVIFGAAGIIGQHLRLLCPEGVEPIYTRTQADSLHLGVDLTNPQARKEFLETHKPDAIINLAGENRPDVVERAPHKFSDINVTVPAALSWWCGVHDCHYIHVSSQAVFGGQVQYPPAHMRPQDVFRDPPYSEDSTRIPVNAYGLHKLKAEQEVKAAGDRWTIVRPTFVLGVRPIPTLGRMNPIEQMLAPSNIAVEGESVAVQRHVNNRWFSVSFARDVAAELWRCVMTGPQKRTIHVGVPYAVTRYDIAAYLRPDVEAIAHEDLEGYAPRPVNTAYAGDGTWDQVRDGLYSLREEYEQRERMTREQRARELAIFLGKSEDECLFRLRSGFGELHQAVTDDFRKANPQNDDELLEWYRTTEAYLWELSAYHCDPGFNYMGMCDGIAQALKSKGVSRVLCLGDGIGDLTITLRKAGMQAFYHDLRDSRTAAFAEFRIKAYAANSDGEGWYQTSGWNPPDIHDEFDAVVSLDVLEHMTRVEDYVRAIHEGLKQGGWLVAQNAFAMASGPDGGMPMHLERNDRFERDWDPLLFSLGFRQECPQWYQKL